MQSKYIVYKLGGREMMHIFPITETHKMIASRIVGPLNPVISAGFIMANEKGSYCYGESETLEKVCRQKEDTALLGKMGFLISQYTD